MNKEQYRQICSIKKENKSWDFYDCNDDKLRTPSSETNFTSAMHRRYMSKYYSNKDCEKDRSTVWVLIGFNENDNKEIFEQVGRTIDIIRALEEIRDDVKEFYCNNETKDNKKNYGNLKNKDYKKIVFCEVLIDNYLIKDRLFVDTYGKKSKNKSLCMAYNFLKAAYVEGKIGYEESVRMYNKSSLDGYFYTYYKKINYIYH